MEEELLGIYLVTWTPNNWKVSYVVGAALVVDSR
jgi:hypothetical protein